MRHDGVDLYGRLCSFENLWSASRKARLGKRCKAQVAEFEYELERNLFRLQHELAGECYEFGGYRMFTIKEPKERLICAAPYADRVVHHALCNVIEPILDRAMIYDTWACRTGKGSHAALERARHFLRGSRWILKLDVRKFFFCVDHEILMRDLARSIPDERILNLISLILRTYRSPMQYYELFDGDTLFDAVRPRGLPIGNLSSQLFANYHLSGLDRFVKEHLKVGKYLRYMDDCLLFSDSKEDLLRAKREISHYLAARRLSLHPRKTQVFPQKNGISFLGRHLYPYADRLLRANLQRFRRRMRQKSELYSKGAIDMKNLLCSFNAWLGYAGRSRNNLINEILSHIPFKDNDASIHFTFCV